MKRVSCYITKVLVKDGPVQHMRPGIPSYYSVVDNHNKEWIHEFNTESFIPKEKLSFMLCGDVKIYTLLHDVDSDTFFDFKQFILTDRLISLYTRQFITANVIDLNKESSYQGFILVDLEY